MDGWMSENEMECEEGLEGLVGLGLLDWQESEQRARRGHETMNDRARDRARLLSLDLSLDNGQAPPR